MRMLVSAVSYCHDQNVVHRDIKLQNIVLNNKESIQDGVKLIDFGIAGWAERKLEEHKAGTLRYCPPELLNHDSF